MGHLDVISIISDGFNIYFPILVCVLCVATYFNLGQRCLAAIGFQRFIDASDDVTSDLVDEGRQLVNRGAAGTSAMSCFKSFFFTFYKTSLFVCFCFHH